MSGYPTAEFVSNLVFGLFSVACNILLVWQNHRFMKEVKLRTAHHANLAP
ncbi:hypothetical protein F5Y10DRAFT_268196 [Nemania abortiva]|nr:hypothetical protein F5Y10DRAFT_268196 [Nemania abortiva]